MKKKFFSKPVLTRSKVDFLCALFLHAKFMYIMSCWRGKRRKLLTNGPTLLKNAPERRSAHSKCTRCCSKSQRLQDWIQASKSPHFVLSESSERRHKSRLWTWLDFWKFLYCALAGFGSTCNLSNRGDFVNLSLTGHTKVDFAIYFLSFIILLECGEWNVWMY